MAKLLVVEASKSFFPPSHQHQQEILVGQNEVFFLVKRKSDTELEKKSIMLGPNVRDPSACKMSVLIYKNKMSL